MLTKHQENIMRQLLLPHLRCKIMRQAPRYFFILLCVFFVNSFALNCVHALEDQFTVRLNVIDFDVDAPSIPINVTATAASISQIDLTWDASTDNVGVTGYVVSRDSIAIATTTGTTYSDAGLMSDTTYEYVVEAFDASNNYSGQSATTSATTLSPAPPASTSTPSSISGSRSWLGRIGQDLRLEDIAIKPIDSQSVRVDFAMSQPVVATIFWGETTDYELGSASHLLLSQHHNFIIDELNPGSRYFIKIEVRGILGNRAVLGPYTAQTGLSSPVNPYNFSGFSVADSIILSWQYSDFANTSVVRLLRSEKGYPKDPFDGQLIYEGVATAIKDYDVVVGKRYFYALFSVVESSYSSGVVTSVLYQRDEMPLLPEITDQDTVAGDVVLIQNRTLVPRDNVWRALSHQPISVIVTVPSEIRQVLERMIIFFNHGDTLSANSYLLTWHQESNSFRAEIDPGLAGVQSFIIQGYDRFGDVVYQRSGKLIIAPGLMTTTQSAWWVGLMVLVKLVFSLILFAMGWLTLISNLWH